MNTINALFTWLADQLFGPFASVPLAGLLFWSAVTGVAMTCIFGKTSNQRAIRRVADRSRAQLLGIRLFKDDLGVTFHCQIDLLKASGLRFLYSLPPMLVMIVPLAFVLSQLAVRYENRPLRPGEDTVVELRLSADAWPRYQNIELSAFDGIVIETDSLRDEDNRSLTWRIRPVSNQPVTLHWQLDDQAVEKSLVVADRDLPLQVVSARRAGAGIFDRLLNPGEPGFSRTSPVQSITVKYPPRTTPIFGLNVPWWATFFLTSMLVAMLIRRVLRVEF